ncbi:Uncharacterised protein [Bordetella pertussis]|nr:Uncharacterised protein [Bordetella pertussis]
MFERSPLSPVRACATRNRGTSTSDIGIHHFESGAHQVARQQA